jgi:hypothetical protein
MGQQKRQDRDTAAQQIKFDYAVNLPTFLKNTGLTLVMTNYQAHKMMIIGEYEGRFEICKRFRSRLAIEPFIGHLKADHSLSRGTISRALSKMRSICFWPRRLST